MVDTGLLVERNRQAQLRISREASAEVAAAFRLLDLGALDTSFPRYAAAMTAVVNRRRTLSALLAASSYNEVRNVVVGEKIAVVPASVVNPRSLTASLLWAGPVAIKSAVGKGVPLTQSYDVALSKTIGATTRHILDGGRATTYNAVASDPEAKGFQRVSDGNPCAFCAMLISRGAVYKSAQNAGSAKKFHDRCGCSVVPIFGSRQSLGKYEYQAWEYRDLWDEATVKKSGNDAINAFRSLLKEKNL